MKKNFKRVLSLILATCFIISASLCTTIFAADASAVPEKALKYFDGVWTDFAYTNGSEKIFPLPEGITSLNGGNTANISEDTKRSAVFGKAAEDYSLRLGGSLNANNRNVYVDLLRSTDAGDDGKTLCANMSAGDVLTLYVDMAAASLGNAASHGIRVYGKSGNSSYEYFPIIFKTVTNEVTSAVEEKINVFDGSARKDVDYISSTWVSLALEIKMTSDTTSTFTTYADGVKIGQISRDISGITRIQAGLQWRTTTHTQAPELYVDNLEITREAFSADRYKAIEDASAICIADIKGNNADLDNVTTNLTLPEAGSNGSTITWASSNENVISNKGVVTPSATQDTTVTLTATVTSGEASETKAYTVTVPQNELITFDDIKGKNLYEGSIVSNLVLPQKLRNETPIVWESSNTNIIAADGKVTRYNDASHSVTLTAKNASDNSVVKAFDLYVIGDDIVNDNMQNTNKMKSFKNLSYINNAQWLVSGMQIANSTNNGNAIEAVYNAAPGTRVYTDVARYGGARSISFWASPDGVEYTQFGSTKEIDGELIEFSQVGGWRRDLWYNTADVPDGTRYIKVYTANLTSAILRNVIITGNCEDDVTFDDIKGSNSAADKIMSSLVIPEGVTSVTSSNPEIIAADGTVNRAQKDTVVTLTMTINNDMVEATKIFNLTVLGTNEEIKSQKPWILYNDGSKLALVSNSSLAQGCTIEFDADVTYYGETAGKKAVGIVAVYKGTELIEVKTVKFDLASKSEAQRVSTVLTLSKESSEYAGAKVCGFIWEDGTIRNLGKAVTYKAK